MVKSPLTLNYDAFKTSLAELSSRSTTRGGSMLGDAIRLASDAFSEDPEAVGRAIIVLSDGEVHHSESTHSLPDGVMRP